MIHMPHRSVTRFFVPLIDVLLLLFCIFLLMPFANEDEVDKKLDAAEKIKDQATSLSADLDRQMDKLTEMERDKEDIKNVADLRAEIEALRKLVKQTPQQRYNFFIIDIERDDGELSYVDAGGIRKRIKDGQDARNLISINKQRASADPKMRDKGLYYFFLYPRPQEGYPVARQVRQYREWFADVPNSLP